MKCFLFSLCDLDSALFSYCNQMLLDQRSLRVFIYLFYFFNQWNFTAEVNSAVGSHPFVRWQNYFNSNLVQLTVYSSRNCSPAQRLVLFHGLLLFKFSIQSWGDLIWTAASSPPLHLHVSWQPEAEIIWCSLTRAFVLHYCWLMLSSELFLCCHTLTQLLFSLTSTVFLLSCHLSTSKLLICLVWRRKLRRRCHPNWMTPWRVSSKSSIPIQSKKVTSTSWAMQSWGLCCRRSSQISWQWVTVTLDRLDTLIWALPWLFVRLRPLPFCTNPRCHYATQLISLWNLTMINSSWNCFIYINFLALQKPGWPSLTEAEQG